MSESSETTLWSQEELKKSIKKELSFIGLQVSITFTPLLGHDLGSFQLIIVSIILPNRNPPVVQV